ncbi:Calcineurin-like phosphoesterase superfamily domain protein [Stieleria neptunia]|uniref:Calcineurin-like phosphoesterase superfamily domain protein n=1 Tax=Stieleria neptunia TaxID=2527979 RepID=A0A518HU04_9BACT|nr:metallophosphoesterase family protein [Stieleria neptunia]QDV44316.1 Calcineurin-like phosphoesterase superfamily domain protein [Stieleria neptunia]
MKFLCFSDLHRNREAARNLVRLAEEVDVVIGAGDFANRHEGLPDTLEILADIEKPSILVPGNGETVEELRSATEGWTSATVLHGEGCEVGGVPFWGVGGGIPVTPFGDWSYDFDETQATELLSGCEQGGVLVVHSPPLDTVDRDSGRRVRGSQSIRDCVLTKRPRLVVCGHIHDDWEKQVTLEQSLVLNAGPRGVTLEIDFD